MTFPSSHPMPCQPCISQSLSNEKMPEIIVKPTIGVAPRFQEPFRDDFGATAKAFQKLNSFRRLFGVKHLQWNDLHAELAVLRAREFTRSKRIKMPFTVGGSKFNIGVPFVDIVLYIATEYKNGKMVPVEKSLQNAWCLNQTCAQKFLEPLANFAATSVIKNDTMICFSILISRQPPFSFLPRMRHMQSEKEEAQDIEKWDKIMQEIGSLSDSLDALERADDEDDKDVEMDARVDIDKDVDELMVEVRRDTKGMKSMSKPNCQRVIYEAPLMQPPGQTELPLNFFLSPSESSDIEAIFEEDKTMSSD